MTRKGVFARSILVIKSDTRKRIKLKAIRKLRPLFVRVFIINFKPGNPMPLGAGRKGSFFTKKMKNLLFFYSLLKNPAY